ncbi:hypothetical protein HMPREF0185_02046 [Brevundimonas diminuta 470-4]|nr:hypothetical protein HMPREF0185_02046 [Brevundimonas diminuta 470-4]
MARPIFAANKRTEFRIVRITIPAIIVPEILSGIIGWVRENKVDLAAILIQCHHCLKVFAFNQKVFRLVDRRPDMQPRLAPRDSRTHSAVNFQSCALSMEAQRDAM